MEWLNYHHLRLFWTVARHGSVSRAAASLRLAQPTVSAQLRALEQALGARLLERTGRGVALTEVGRVVHRYADDIFTLGRDLQDSVRGRLAHRPPARLVVGIADAVPKLAAVRILAPAVDAGGEVRLICHEGPAERLLDRLGAHEIDVVLADAPIGPSHAGGVYNHLLGECGVAVFGAAPLVRAARRAFPRSLAELPFLLPTAGTTLRRSLDTWLDAHGIAPVVIAELDDLAMIVELGAQGAGLFAAPAPIMTAALRARGLHRAGAITGVRERYYAISTERRLAHPAVVAIATAARTRLFARGRS
jgi:LysR family transcriptional regulator, transcriptional activator of nhaA